MTDCQTVTKYTKADLWKFPFNKQSLFLFMIRLYFALQCPTLKKIVAVCMKWSWMLWILSETYFNQNWLELSYMLSQTWKWNITAQSDHDHLCWASLKTSFQNLHVLWSVYASKRYPGLVFYLLTFQSTALIQGNSLGNLVLFLIRFCFICTSDKKTLHSPTW